MSEDWDRRYREGFYPSSLETHSLLKSFWSYIKSGPVLEIAVGVGRDAIFLAEKGYKTVGVDISFEALKRANEKFRRIGARSSLLINANAANLPFKREVFGCIVVFYFFMRGAINEIKKLLKVKGIVIYETFLKRQNMIDRWRNPEFLLEDGELFRLFDDFECIFYEEGVFRDEGRLRAVARFVGRKR